MFLATKKLNYVAIVEKETFDEQVPLGTGVAVVSFEVLERELEHVDFVIDRVQMRAFSASLVSSCAVADRHNPILSQNLAGGPSFVSESLTQKEGSGAP